MEEKKHLARKQEKKKERTKVQTKDHTRKCKPHNGGAIRGENTKPKT